MYKNSVFREIDIKDSEFNTFVTLSVRWRLKSYQQSLIFGAETAIRISVLDIDYIIKEKKILKFEFGDLETPRNVLGHWFQLETSKLKNSMFHIDPVGTEILETSN